MTQKRPQPAGQKRRDETKARRTAACELSTKRPNPAVPANQEEDIYSPQVPTSFTKGLPSNAYGIVDPNIYPKFVDALTQPLSEAPKIEDLPIGTDVPDLDNCRKRFRGWESPLAGQYYDLEGADVDAVAMAPAPRTGQSELCAEMAEIYAMALLRDVPFSDLTNGATELNKSLTGVDLIYPNGHPKADDGIATLQDLIDELNKLSWFDTSKPTFSSVVGQGNKLTRLEQRRRAARVPGAGKLTVQNLFRGSAAGNHTGPYISQFMLLGTSGRAGGNGVQGNIFATSTAIHNPQDGVITFGANTIDQRIYQNKPRVDFMTNWRQWLRVQQGENVHKNDVPDQWEAERRFIETPRDLATYVHFDQLYQAYFNACLIMLTNGVPFDPGFPNAPPRDVCITPHKRGQFATFGAPHILSLMTEVATRGLKAVRRQKFQVHRRARPEVLAARLTMAANGQGMELGGAAPDLMRMLDELGYAKPEDDSKPGVLLYWVALMNKQRNDPDDNAADAKQAVEYPSEMKAYSRDANTPLNFLLPMAFPEGSPMHPAYGAGHATVAAACVTVLKAFFLSENSFKICEKNDAGNACSEKEVSTITRALRKDEFHIVERANDKSDFSNRLTSSGESVNDQTLGGELDKLAANVAIGRNFAGVHYYTDYYDSMRMGERIAVSILEEQMLNYPEKVCMSFTSFDGARVDIRTAQDPATGAWNQVEVLIDGDPNAYESWWVRDTAEYDDPSIDATVMQTSQIGM